MSLTPEQFNLLTTKKDLENYYTKSEMDQKFDLVLSAVDAVMREIINIRHDFTSNQAAHDRFETRITRTEKELGLNPYSFSIAKDK